MDAGKTERLGVLLVLAAGLTWGITAPLVKIMGDLGASAALVSLLRVGFAFLVMLAVTVVRYGWESLCVDARTLGACALLGVVCHGVYNIMYSCAALFGGVTVASVLLNVAPVFTALGSLVLFGERLGAAKCAAMALVMAGCALAVTGGSLDLGGASLLGVACGVGAGLCYGLTAVFGRLTGTRCNAFVGSTYSYLFATVSTLPFLGIMGGGLQVSGAILGIGFLYALVPTALGYVLYYEGVRRMSRTSMAPVVASVETVIAVLLGTAFFGDVLGPVNIAGIALVLAAIALSNLPAGKRTLPPPRRP